MLKFDDKNVVGTVKIQLNLSDDDICNIVVSALESASNYWVGVCNSGDDWDSKPSDEPVATWVTKLLLEGKTVKLYDIEDDEKEFELTLKKLIKGIQKHVTTIPTEYNKYDWDDGSYDCMLQCALFGEVVYG